MNNRVMLIAITALTGTVAQAQPAPPAPDRPGRPPPQHTDRQRKPQELGGTVQSYNLAPRGNYEGLLIKDGDRVVQINFPPDMGAAITQAAPVGEQVKMQVIPQMSMPDHPVYDLVSITGPKGQELKLPRPGERKVLHADGSVKHLNYDRTGQVNGAVLETGEFVFIGPDASNMDLKPGQKLKADGRGAIMPDGKNIINAETVNGVTVHKPQPPMGPGPVAFRDGERARDGAPRDGAPRDGEPRARFQRMRGDDDRGDRPPGNRQRGDGPRENADRRDADRDGRPDARDYDRKGPRDGGPRQRDGNREPGFRPPGDGPTPPDPPPTDPRARPPKAAPHAPQRPPDAQDS